jgi:hypothetical protein
MLLLIIYPIDVYMIVLKVTVQWLSLMHKCCKNKYGSRDGDNCWTVKVLNYCHLVVFSHREKEII